MHDIQNWTIIPGFAGHFDTIEKPILTAAQFTQIASSNNQYLIYRASTNPTNPRTEHSIQDSITQLHWNWEKKAVKVIDLGGDPGAITSYLDAYSQTYILITHASTSMNHDL